MSNTGKMGRSSAIIGSAGVVNKDFLFHFLPIIGGILAVFIMGFYIYNKWLTHHLYKWGERILIICINYLILFLSVLGLFRMFITFWFANAYDNLYIRYRHKYMNCYKHYSPTITIIVPAFNEEKAIYQTLTSVYNNDYRKKKLL